MSTTDPPLTDRVGPARPDDAQLRERRRNRRVIVASGVLTVIVMAAVVVLGWQGRRDNSPSGPTRSAPSAPTRSGTPPGSDVPWSAAPDDCPSDPEKPPRLVFDLPPSGLHFGSVKQGIRVEKEVVFRNEGSGPLCIRRVESGCGCIKARLVGEERRFEAGEEGRILIVLDTKGREGEQKKTIQIYTNAVDVPLQRFVVRASVDLGLRYSPSRLHFGKATAGQPAEARLRLRAPRGDADWTVTSVQGTQMVDGAPVAYEWTLEEIPDPRDRVVEIRIRHPGLSGSGPVFDDTIVVRTSHPDRPEFTVRAHMQVVEAIMASPRRATLGFVPNSIPARIRLRRIDPSVEFEITGLTFESTDGEPIPDGESGFVAVHGRESGDDPWVEVTYDGREGRPPGPLRAVLVVHTDFSAIPDLRVECWANVRAR